MANRYKKTKKQTQNPDTEIMKKARTPATVWIARILIFALCAAVAVTLIPSAFF